MIRQPLLIGSLLLALASPTVMQAQSAASSASAGSAGSTSSLTLYTRIKQEVTRENATNTFDDEVITYLRLAFAKKWGLTTEQIQNVLKGNTEKACAAAPDGDKLRNKLSCQAMITDVTQLATREQKIRTLGRRLTSIVSGYELPLSGLPDRSLHLSTDLLGILNIWSAGTGNIQNKPDTPLIRTVSIDGAKALPGLQALSTALNALSPEERTAAVWRYQSGFRLVTGNRAPTFPKPLLPDASTTGTERQYLGKNWRSIESGLDLLWQMASTTTLDPPLAANEVAYVRFVRSGLPDNVLVWVRIGSQAAGSLPYGDAGLDWDVPIDPVLPSLKKDGSDDAILGGNFPPEPVTVTNGKKNPLDGMELCSDPLAIRGYLCRPIVTTEADRRCPVEVPTDSKDITLVHCTMSSDPNKSPLQWCDMDSHLGGTCKPLDPTACENAGGFTCGTLDQCKSTFSCTPDPAPSTPTLCCLKKSANQCAMAGSRTECTQRGGIPSADANACVQNGCDAPAPPADIRYTTASADVCREIDWKKPEAFDPNTQCKIDMKCTPTCNLSPNATATTGVKQADGTIPFCMMANPAFWIGTYTMYHELVHVTQLCNQPPGTRTYETAPVGASAKEKASILDRNSEKCCQVEGEAHRLTCELMERDGVFNDPAGKPIVQDGIEFTAQTCAEMLTDYSCGPKGENFKGCYTSVHYTDAFVTKFKEISKNNNPKNVPDLCKDAIDPVKMDPRVKALKDEIEHRDNVCTPSTDTSYLNRIGNNFCYIGQCVEQSVELHRITPGQSPSGVQSAVAPWNDPITGTPLGNLLTNPPPVSEFEFPAYRPQLLAHTLDAALCESAGLPALMPPALCTAEALRQLSQSRSFGFETALGLIGQTNETQVNLNDLMGLSRGIGVRTGTELYGDYLRESSRSFAAIIGMAAELLRQLNSVHFPTQMCPISPGLPSPASASASAASQS